MGILYLSHPRLGCCTPRRCRPTSSPSSSTPWSCRPDEQSTRQSSLSPRTLMRSRRQPRCKRARLRVGQACARLYRTAVSYGCIVRSSCRICCSDCECGHVSVVEGVVGFGRWWRWAGRWRDPAATLWLSCCRRGSLIPSSSQQRAVAGSPPLALPARR